MSEEWYREGLRFECTGCGKCCTGGPGYVWVNEEERMAIATHLGLSHDDFCKKYIRQSNGKLSLLEKHNYDCIFLKDNKCQIYQVRPTQCKTFPFWPENLRSPEKWEGLRSYCEGLDSKDVTVSFDTIEKERLIQIKRNKNH